MNVHFMKDGSTITIQAQQDDLFPEIANKYLNKIGQADPNKLIFFFNNQILKYAAAKSLSEYGIFNNSIINVFSQNQNQNFFVQNPNYFSNPVNFGNFGNAGASNYLNILFIINGRKISIHGKSDSKFCDLVKSVYTKSNIDPNDKPKFILNSHQISPDEQKTLTQIGLRDNSSIEVFLQSQVVGA